MNGIVLGVAMLVHSTGVSPAPEMSRATVARAAVTFDLPDGAATLRSLSHRHLNAQPRAAWRVGSLLPAPATTAKRHTKTDRIIALAAGAFGGFMAGGMIGYAVTQKSSDDDGVSGLRGVVIGAPIGAVVGAVIGYRLMR
jgi:hypothetical protein